MGNFIPEEHPIETSGSGRNSRIVAMRHVDGLDANERQILVCLVRGMSNRHIAVASGTSLENVERFRASMMTKLLVKRTADAVRIGLLAGVDRAD